MIQYTQHSIHMTDTTIINIRVPAEKKEELKELARYAYLLGLIEKPELAKLFEFGMNLAFEECYRHYKEIRGRK